MLRREIFEKEGRRYFYNPKPDANKIYKPFATYSSAKIESNVLIKYADNGAFVDPSIPIWFYPLGDTQNAFYTIENGKPRECFTYTTYKDRRKLMYPDSFNRYVDVRSDVVRVTYNHLIGTNKSFVYATGPNAGLKEVPRALEITVVDISRKKKTQEERMANLQESQNYRYYVITEEGHIDPVVSKKNFTHRPIHAQECREIRYNYKVKRLKAEKQKLRKACEKDPKRIRLDEEIPSLNKKFKNESNDIDNSMSLIDVEKDNDVYSSAESSLEDAFTLQEEAEVSPTHALIVKIPMPTVSSQIKYFIEDNEEAKKNNRFSLTNEAHDHAREEEKSLASPEKSLQAEIMTTPIAPKLTAKFVWKSEDKDNTHIHSTTQSDFFNQRQQILSVTEAKKRVMDISKKLHEVQKTTIIKNTGNQAVRERLNKLNPPYKPQQRVLEKKATTGFQMSSIFDHPNTSFTNKNEMQNQPKKISTQDVLKKKMAALKRGSKL